MDSSQGRRHLLLADDGILLPPSALGSVPER
jgi:hypothetical protein